MITVGFTSLDDFIAELADADGLPLPSGISDKIVRWAYRRTPEQKEAISFQVDVFATAIIIRPDADYLAEFGATCGSDTQNNEAAGSKAANTLKQRLTGACEPLSLKVLPGKIEVY